MYASVSVCTHTYMLSLKYFIYVTIVIINNIRTLLCDDLNLNIQHLL